MEGDRYFAAMYCTVGQIASDWIAYARLVPEEVPEEVFAGGLALIDLVLDDPAKAFVAIKMVIERYPEADFYSFENSEAQRVVGLLAAGPLEDLLDAHGHSFIEAVEAEALKDRRMAWTLGGVWQLTMPDDVWLRVQRAADNSYWERSVTG